MSFLRSFDASPSRAFEVRSVCALENFIRHQSAQPRWHRASSLVESKPSSTPSTRDTSDNVAFQGAVPWLGSCPLLGWTIALQHCLGRAPRNRHGD